MAAKKKAAAKRGSKKPKRTPTKDLTPAQVAKAVKQYAKAHGLAATEATHRLLGIAIQRLAALARYNSKATKKAAPAKAAKKRTAKAKSKAGGAKSTKAKPKASRKPRAPKVTANGIANGLANQDAQV